MIHSMQLSVAVAATLPILFVSAITCYVGFEGQRLRLRNYVSELLLFYSSEKMQLFDSQTKSCGYETNMPCNFTQNIGEVLRGRKAYNFFGDLKKQANTCYNKENRAFCVCNTADKCNGNFTLWLSLWKNTTHTNTTLRDCVIAHVLQKQNLDHRDFTTLPTTHVSQVTTISASTTTTVAVPTSTVTERIVTTENASTMALATTPTSETVSEKMVTTASKMLSAALPTSKTITEGIDALKTTAVTEKTSEAVTEGKMTRVDATTATTVTATTSLKLETLRVKTGEPTQVTKPRIGKSGGAEKRKASNAESRKGSSLNSFIMLIIIIGMVIIVFLVLPIAIAFAIAKKRKRMRETTKKAKRGPIKSKETMKPEAKTGPSKSRESLEKMRIVKKSKESAEKLSIPY
ncbi:unnamed protein product [Cylicocyclus nassatus]|uniref:Uncharacterized protein n=1 Tax=Cylicocyclus nassatus TaxID=53992 RepID=A0AA36GFL0_CYLNA|nr:unnamed protein product [Cylicocyclus nassatus]